METLFNIGIVLLCLAASMGINRVFVCFNFYNHIDFSGKRYLHIDGIRGIAALLVVLNHAVFSLSNNGFNPLSVNTSNFWVFAHAGDVGVQIFFCITGFLFFDKIIKTGNKINWEMFFVSRVKRLVPMYLIASTIVLVLTLMWSHGGQDLTTTARQAINLFGFGFFGSDIWVNGFRTYSLNAVIWTLPYEWKFYCILPVICAAIRFKSIAVIGSVLSVGYAVNDLYSGQVVWVYFISGALSAILFNRMKMVSVMLSSNKITNNFFSAASALTIIYLLYTMFSGYGWERFLITTLLFNVIVMAKPSVFTFKPLVYLGEASYSSYLLHLIINALVIKFIGFIFNLNNISAVGFWTLILSIVSITTIVTAYTFKYVEYRFIKK
ncbi:acyltransferase family protein [Escherichia coli]|uniref:acyltransferase family protein n=1 Tax=Escherichia coli TaxID=562 RepID=UPI0010BA2A49|nr:acyltransferase [Escherichia coli]GCH75284.1 hypothetical protein BvCms39BK_02025 [Escherichia coli]